jgi:hypothetical protein
MTKDVFRVLEGFAGLFECAYQLHRGGRGTVRHHSE